MPAPTRQRKKSTLRRLVVPAAALAALSYFGFHALNGELGLVGRARIEHEVRALEVEHDRLVKQREALVAQVTLLRPESLNPDMLDEQARRNLNVVQSDELVILTTGR
ncbi:cell division protein [Roseibium aquae]|uniref:Cell division protein n=1 Tax=Roseibium aquae TaxID=1323746 RepID=A0A916THZ6_9HYPH|nr:septum formation initiator family protein [Roseibium aquae]GGB45072.1 cell division protein [Roseibium aquae]